MVADAGQWGDFPSWIEIDGLAFETNVRTLLAELAGRAKLCAVIKSDAYGHGAELLVPTLVRLHVPFIGVGSNTEAAIARRCAFTGRLLRVRAAAPQEVVSGLALGIEELVCDTHSAAAMSAAARRSGREIRIHLDINSAGISSHSL